MTKQTKLRARYEKLYPPTTRPVYEHCDADVKLIVDALDQIDELVAAVDDAKRFIVSMYPFEIKKSPGESMLKRLDETLSKVRQ